MALLASQPHTRKEVYIIRIQAMGFTRLCLGLGISSVLLFGAYSSANADISAQESTPSVTTVSEATLILASTGIAPSNTGATPTNPQVEQEVPIIITPAPIKPVSIQEHATMVAKKHNIPPKIFFALIWQESKWNHKAISRAGAIGLTQVMPRNVKAMGYRLSRFKTSPVAQLEAGAKYLSWQYKFFKRWDLALAAYNAGPGAVRRYAGIPPYRETRNYVKKIMSMSR